MEQVAADALLNLLNPVRRTAFRDAYVDVPFRPVRDLVDRDNDPGTSPEPVRKQFAVGGSSTTTSRPDLHPRGVLATIEFAVQLLQ